MKVTVEHGDLRELTLLESNARFMRHETFQALVANIRRDGVLTQLPFVWHDVATGRRIVLSGNHRVQAALEAGITESHWQQTDDPLPRAQQLALQLSHNAITGQDDPTLLRALYDEIDSTDWRLYSGLDDKSLDLLDQADVGSLSEANLDFQTIQLVFLPHELDRAQTALRDAAAAVSADGRWLAAISSYQPTLEALQTARFALGVGNVATALMAVLSVFEAHLDDLRHAWLDPQDHLPRHKGQVPIETLIGRTLPAEAGATIGRALDRAVGRGEVNPKHPWQLLERLAADYLAGE